MYIYHNDFMSHVHTSFTLLYFCLFCPIYIYIYIRYIRYRYVDLMTGFDIFCLTAFTTEFGLRLWSCVEDPDIDEETYHGRLTWILRPLCCLDLLALLPFYLSVLSYSNDVSRGSTVLRLLRIISLFRFERQLKCFRRLQRVFVENETEFFIVLFLTGTILVVGSTVVYFLENDAQPDDYPNIPATMWWAICTMATVGYGDVVPITIAGKLVSTLLMVMGVMLFSVPASLLSAGLIQDFLAERLINDSKKRKSITQSNLLSQYQSSSNLNNNNINNRAVSKHQNSLVGVSEEHEKSGQTSHTNQHIRLTQAANFSGGGEGHHVGYGQGSTDQVHVEGNNDGIKVMVTCPCGCNHTFETTLNLGIGIKLNVTSTSSAHGTV